MATIANPDVLDINAEADDGDSTIDAVFSTPPYDSDSWDTETDLIISPVFLGTDTLAYIDDLESGEVPILYQKFYDDYEDATVTLFSITPRLTHTEISSEDLDNLLTDTASGDELFTGDGGSMVEEGLVDDTMTEEQAAWGLQMVQNLSELAQQRTNVPNLGN